jgi:hypothetical protein
MCVYFPSPTKNKIDKYTSSAFVKLYDLTYLNQPPTLGEMKPTLKIKIAHLRRKPMQKSAEKVNRTLLSRQNNRLFTRRYFFTK